MTKLITGGTGYVGAELAHILVERGEEVVIFDRTIKRYRIEDIEKKVKVVRGDLGDLSEVLNVVKDNHISQIYHMGGILTYASELDPWGSFRGNVIGTYNVLEAARLFGVQKMMLTSTIGTFGLQMESVITDISIQRPVTMYGCGKLYAESLGRFYRKRFGLDFRSIRYAHMVGPNVHTQGHWAPPMIEDAILGRPHETIYATPETMISPIYVKDAARAADMILQAPKEHVRMVNYNVAGVPKLISAKEVEAILKERFPGTKIAYKVDPSVPPLRGRFDLLKVLDDSYARNEWGWKPEYATTEAIIDVFEKDMKSYPRRYGLT